MSSQTLWFDAVGKNNKEAPKKGASSMFLYGTQAYAL